MTIKYPKYFWLIFLLVVNISYLFLTSKNIFFYKYNPDNIDRYLHSQDMVENIVGRVFISDSEIYESAGYLYAAGSDPTDYNAPHPPLIKYLFGFASFFFGNPFLVQILFSVFLVTGTYFLGIKLFKSQLIGIVSSILLIFDPVYKEAVSNTFLDLGQAVFSLYYILVILVLPQSWLIQGILLGASAAAKFWSTTIALFVFVAFYKHVIIKEKIDLNYYLKKIVTAGLTFSLVYLVSFIQSGGAFNLPIFQLKMLKFMLDHNSATTFGGSLMLFLTGNYSTWWEASEVVRAHVWSVLWPVGLAASIFVFLKNRKNYIGTLAIYPLFNLISTATAVPFPRYFIIILPFIYLSIVHFAFRLGKVK